MTTVLCLGGPLHGERVTPDTCPPPHEVIAAVPLVLPIGLIDLDQPIPPYEPPQQVRYRLQWRKTGGGGREPVYVAPDFTLRPFTPPIVGRALAAIYAQHGLREGEHYIVNWEEP